MRGETRSVTAALVAMLLVGGCGQSTAGTAAPATTAPVVTTTSVVPPPITYVPESEPRVTVPLDSILPVTPGPVAKGPRPGNGAVIVRRGAKGRGVLDIDNGTDHDAYVTVAGGGKLVLAVYARNGAKAHVTGVPDGTFDIFVSSGSGWNSDLRAFTADKGFSRFDDTFPYETTRTQYSIWTITLQPSTGGNASTSDVDEDAVPR